MSNLGGPRIAVTRLLLLGLLIASPAADAAANELPPQDGSAASILHITVKVPASTIQAQARTVRLAGGSSNGPMSGNVARRVAAGADVPMQSENVLAEAASWLEDTERWPDERRPVSLDPLYRQTQSLHTLLKQLLFDLGSATTLAMLDARVSMTALRVNVAELRALLQLTGRANLEIDTGQL